MEFVTLIHTLKMALQNSLPGERAHAALRAIPEAEVMARFQHVAPPRRGSVLILLYEDDGVIKIPLTKRADYKGIHGAQVSLPGGKAEGDEHPHDTALRETEEETGIDRNSITILGSLTDFYVIPSNFMVTPVVGYLSHTPIFRPDPYEVDRIITLQFDLLVANDAILNRSITIDKTHQRIAPHFVVEDEIVWGATAMMLNEFREVVREARI